MIVINVPVANCTPQTIVIGRRGTYETMQIAFDLPFLIENYGSGTAVLAIKRSQDESAYPAVVTQEDSTLLWTVNETDTAYVGAGECQLMWYVDGGLAKTIIYPMVVMRDILSTSEEPPDGYENWIEHLTELGAETQQNAQDAAQSASDAENAKDDAVAAKEAAEAAQEAAETAVTHYPTIQNNYWMVWDSATQQYVSTGIQAEGDDGYSPEVTITSIEGGHRVTITDKDHPQGQSFDVMDGESSATAVSSVNGKTGAVVLDSGDIGYDGTETYQNGTAGAALSELNRHLSDKADKTNYVTVTGTTLTLNPAVDNTMYLCGELTELTVTAPATGIFAVRFTSGTTPTVVTLTGITMPDDWEGAEANKTYEINVLDGKGVYASWS